MRDQALNELVDLLGVKHLWFQQLEEEHKSVEDTPAGPPTDSTELFGSKGKVSQKTRNLRMIWYGLFFSKLPMFTRIIYVV